jgi:hypothetical protein
LNDIFLDESFMFPIAAAPARYVAAAKVKGVTHTLHEAFSYTNAWMEA